MRRNEAGDAEVVACAVEGNEHARRAIYERHAGSVVRRLWRLCGQRELARDLTQDAFVIAFTRLHELRDAEAIAAWLHGIAFNLLRDHRKAQSRRTLQRSGAPGPTPSHADGEDALIARLCSALSELDEDKRDAFVLRVIEGASIEETANVLGIAIATVSYRVKKAETHVRAYFEAESIE